MLISFPHGLCIFLLSSDIGCMSSTLLSHLSQKYSYTGILIAPQIISTIFLDWHIDPESQMMT